ncbi:unnamed protein product [Pocillopora meandrina]|uniref:Uncharacterized protein n=1 Tax=Pocillopora meandrina TaxID=46732 RepID=A0AAU9XKR7_9CNID|nr:unnamed protein product [Pocillopora meandrina]
MLYGSMIWTSSGKENLLKVLRLQKCAMNSDTHNRSTHFCNLHLSCPRCKRSKEAGQTFAVRATKEWNNLSVDL